MTDSSSTPAPRPHNPKIHDGWSPEQALAVYDFLDDLRESIRLRYREPINKRMRFEYQVHETGAQIERPPFNDETPF